MNFTLKVLLVVAFTLIQTKAQKSFYEPQNLNDVKWSVEDFGRMWTFDNVPIEDFEKKYGFKPTQEWLDDVQKSALQFGGGCSAAFVSEDGLIMTNHHCGRGRLSEIQKEDENLLKDGFYAETLEDERKVEGLFVDQLMMIENVTDIVKNYMEKGSTDDEKIKFREEIKDSLVKKYNAETGLNCRVVTLYNGGKYSLYGYKRYNDIRLVMAPDFQIAATGWDWDNFTYPRYELDFMFYRAYDGNGNPVKCENYFTWSKKGAEVGEPIFVVGRPGSTDRLLSVEELNYLRDYAYPNYLVAFNEIYYAYYDYYMNHLDKEELLNDVMGWGNARKSYAGRLSGLKDEYIMIKKIDFENELILKVKNDTDLNEKYGEVWNSLKIVLNELKDYSSEYTVVRASRFLNPIYFKLASDLIKIAEQKELDDDKRQAKYQDKNIDETIEKLFPEEIDLEMQNNLMIAHRNFLSKVIGEDSDLFNSIYAENSISDLVNKTKISSKENFLELTKLSLDELKEINDSFINYILKLNKLGKEVSPKVRELNNTLDVLNQSLGEVISKIYKDKIPPDATSTLRISDGVIKGYEYNGTIAPGKTTYYGLWDRYESFNKKTYPWGLHERWQAPPEELDLSTDIGFASTNDIVGGNSGSSAINVNQEVIGLVHDGNIESLSGHTIFLEENNRTVATDSDGLINALMYVYKTDRLVNELLKSKIE